MHGGEYSAQILNLPPAPSVHTESHTFTPSMAFLPQASRCTAARRARRF